jgi:dienelactone hydrolase
LVIFAHGSGSSRFSERNIFVAEALQKQQISTLLFDLLTQDEDRKYEHRFNIELLFERLVIATKYMQTIPACEGFQVGYFGASTGAAAAFFAAAKMPHLIKAMVSRGGRPDLAIAVAPKIKASTLLIVGERDEEVLRLNQKVISALHCEKSLQIVPSATHLFEEPGALARVSLLASEWFNKYL